MAKLKNSITETEYKKLILSVKRNKIIRARTKENYLRTFTILYYTGLRLNEVQELTIKHIKELFDKGITKIATTKTDSERKLYNSENFQNDLIKLFDFQTEHNEMKVISKGSDKNRMTGLNKKEYTRQINLIMKEVLGEGFSSHSFRQGLLTEMGAKGINISIIRDFVGHSNSQTTMGYIKATDEQIKQNLVR